MQLDPKMQLEQRVKTLEYEMKILKSEVQRTLLDIQEQVLIHYYPSLRAEEALPSDGVVQAFESLKAGREEAQPQAVSPPPITRKVSLDEAKTVQERSLIQKQLDQESFVALSRWAMDSVAKLGKERTSKLLELYARRGFLASESKNVLLQLVSLGSEDDPLEKVSINEILSALTGLNELLGRGANPEEAISLIEEVGLG